MTANEKLRLISGIVNSIDLHSYDRENIAVILLDTTKRIATAGEKPPPPLVPTVEQIKSAMIRGKIDAIKHLRNRINDVHDGPGPAIEIQNEGAPFVSLHSAKTLVEELIEILAKGIRDSGVNPIPF